MTEIVEAGAKPESTLPSPRDWATIGVAFALASLPAVMPVMVAALTPVYDLSSEQAGFVASSNMGGVLVGSLMSNAVLHRVGERTLLVGGILLMVATNLLSMIPLGYSTLLVVRALSGLGGGAAMAIGYSLMAGARHPARVMGFYSASQGVMGVVGMGGLLLLVSAYGAPPFFLIMSGIGLLGLFLVPFALAGRTALRQEEGASGALTKGAVAGLAAIFIFFCGMALVWALLARIAEAHGFETARVAGALSASSFAGIGGSLMVAFLSHRLSTALPLLLGVVLVVVSAMGLTSSDYILFAVAICLSSFVWTFEFPFLFRFVAGAGEGRRVGAWVPVATSGGLAIGPAIGGILLGHGGIILLASAFAIIAGGALLLPALFDVANSRRASSEPTGDIADKK